VQTLGTMFSLGLGVWPLVDHFLHDCFVCLKFFINFMLDCVLVSVLPVLLFRAKFWSINLLNEMLLGCAFGGNFACVVSLSLGKGCVS